MVKRLSINEDFDYNEANILRAELQDNAASMGIYRGDDEVFAKALTSKLVDSGLTESQYDEFTWLVREWISKSSDFIKIEKKLYEFAKAHNLYDIFG